MIEVSTKSVLYLFYIPRYLKFKNTKYKDNTVYNRILPQTGALPWFVLSFVIVTMIGIVSYFKFKNINK